MEQSLLACNFSKNSICSVIPIHSEASERVKMGIQKFFSWIPAAGMTILAFCRVIPPCEKTL